MTELSSLAEQISVNERTLRRAMNQGTIRATRPSPKKIELPLSERAFIRRAWPVVSALRGALRTEPNVRLAVLFGSTATGTDSPDSDVDLLVSLRDSGLERLVDLSTKLSGAAGRRVDVVPLEDATTEPAFLADVIGQGRVVVDRDALWPGLLRRERSLRRRGQARESQRLRDAFAGIDRLLGR